MTRLDDNQQAFLVNCLSVAIEEYDKIAKHYDAHIAVCVPASHDGYRRLADQFRRQADQALKMRDAIENADAIELRTGG